MSDKRSKLVEENCKDVRNDAAGSFHFFPMNMIKLSILDTSTNKIKIELNPNFFKKCAKEQKASVVDSVIEFDNVIDDYDDRRPEGLFIY